MIVKMPNGYLREKINGHIAISYKNKWKFRSSNQTEIPISLKENILSGLVGIHTSNSLGDGSFVLGPAQSFEIQAIESFLYTTTPKEFLETIIKCQIGEKSYLMAPIVGREINKNNFFNHHEFEHQPDGTCNCPKIFPLQECRISILNVPNKSFSLQVSIIGNVFRPVP